MDQPARTKDDVADAVDDMFHPAHAPAVTAGVRVQPVHQLKDSAVVEGSVDEFGHGLPGPVDGGSQAPGHGPWPAKGL